MKNIEKLLNMSYLEIIEYLKNKYGPVSKNYFSINGSKTGGIGRGNEGLYIHHIDEDKMILLSTNFDKHPIINGDYLNEEQIKLVKEDYQKADRLVYCDLLEHLLLHLKIIKEPKPIIPNITVGLGGAINFIIPELNDIYSGIKYKKPWKKVVINSVINRKDEYFKLLNYGVNELDIDIESFYSSFNSYMPSSDWSVKNNLKLFKDFTIYIFKNKK